MRCVWLFMTCRARVLLGKTEWPQFGAQEWDIREKVGKIACQITAL